MIAAFCDLVSWGDGRLTEQACRAWLGDVFEPFRSAGLLRSGQPAATVLCEECFEQHVVPVEWSEVDQRSTARCPIGGVFPVEDAQIATVMVDLERCLSALQKSLVAGQRGIRVLIPGKAWYLGIVQTGDIDWNAILIAGRPNGGAIADLIDITAKLPQCMLDVVLTTESASLPTLRLARPLHTLLLAEIADWADGNIVVRQVLLQRWLQRFMSGEAIPTRRAGRPGTKTAWLAENWRRYEAYINDLLTDNARARLLSNAYRKETGGQTISRATVVKHLDEVMPDRVKNCQ